MSDISIHNESEMNSSFLAGLEEIGLGGIGPPNKEQPKSKKNKPSETESKTQTKTVEKKANPPKKGARPPRLADLTASLPIFENNTLLPKYIDIEEKTLPKKEERTISTSFPIETRITQYLQNSLYSLSQEFLQHIKIMFEEKDIVSSIVQKLSTEIQEEIRNNIVFQIDPPNRTHLLTEINTYMMPLKEIASDCENSIGFNYSKIDQSLIKCRASALSQSKSIFTLFNESLDEFSSQIDDLSTMRTISNLDFRKKMSKLSSMIEKTGEYEAKLIEIDSEISLAHKKLNTLEEQHAIHSEIPPEEVYDNVRDAIDLIKNEISYQNEDNMKEIRKSSFMVEDYFETIHSMRQMKDYLWSIFQETVANIDNNQSHSIADDQLIDNLSDIESPGQDYSPSLNLKKQLHSISKQNLSQLKNASEFLDSTKRKERKPHRKKITDVSLLSST